MTCTYHYHATIHSHEMIHLDGLLTTNDPINNWEKYSDAKRVIAGDTYDASTMVLISLSLLHETPK